MSPVPDLPDADAVAAAIATCPSISGLSGGMAGEIATYLPGRRVSGVRTNPAAVEVHVISKYGSPLPTVDSEVRAAVQAAVPGPLTVDVVVADVEDPFAPEPEPPALPPGGKVPEEPPALPPAGAVPVAGAAPAPGASVGGAVVAGSTSPTSGVRTSATPPTANPTSGNPTTGTPTTGPPAARVPPPPTAP